MFRLGTLYYNATLEAQQPPEEQRWTRSDYALERFLAVAVSENFGEEGVREIYHNFFWKTPFFLGITMDKLSNWICFELSYSSLRKMEEENILKQDLQPQWLVFPNIFDPMCSKMKEIGGSRRSIRKSKSFISS